MLTRRALYIAALGLLVACGPNYRYVYDGESAFERCYANDFDPAVALPVRSRCWQEWLQAYSYGGAADRVEFARGRLTALEAQTTAPSAASASAEPPSPAPSAPVTTPPVAASGAQASTAPPASVGDAWRAAPPTLPSTAPSPTQSATQADPPGATCAQACRAAWHLASGRCAQRDAACVAQSDEAYRDCMRGCF